MKFGYYYGAMYVELETGEEVAKEGVLLAGHQLTPGDYVQKLGHKKRSSFEMNEGFYLKYEGRIDSNILLFSTNCKRNPKEDDKRIYYAFFYINENTLFLKCHENAGYDIHLKSIEIFKDVRKRVIEKQLSFI